jgi:DNA-binding NarL/FixJ family response regulator
MARVLALTADLLFGSRVQGALVAAGHDVELIVDGGRLRDRLADGAAPEADVLVVDLTDAQLDAAAVVAALNGEGELDTTRTLGFYSHVEADARERAERAGVELVVPRSRMAREGAELISTLLASPPA